MDSHPVRFKITFKEINIEFEGDIRSAQIAQTAVNHLMNSLTEVQNKLLQLETKVSHESSNAGEQPASNTTLRRRRRSGGNSPARNQIVTLRQEGFFDQKRALGEVRDMLAQKGHNYKSNALSSPLLVLTQQGILQREQNEGNWIYWKGANDGSGESQTSDS